MTTIDLITGFLGSGKTTFIREYAKFLINRGENIAILENDYGAVNVDLMLLQELEGEKCELEMVPPGYDLDCHRRRFKTKLIQMGMLGYDRVLVEPSGIYDVDEFFDVLCEDPLDRWYRIGNVITLANASLEEKLSESAEYLLASQAAPAGAIVISGAGNADTEQISRVTAHLERAIGGLGLTRSVKDRVIPAELPELTAAQLEMIASCGYVRESHRKLPVMEENHFSSVYVMNRKPDEASVRALVRSVFADPALGKVLRVKGFFMEEGQWYQVNATKDIMTKEAIPEGQDVLIVIGEDLNREAIGRLLEG